MGCESKGGAGVYYEYYESGDGGLFYCSEKGGVGGEV